jgi:hypothetical protein
MKQIWKYPLEETFSEVTIDMPSGAKVLSFQTQRTIAPKPLGRPKVGFYHGQKPEPRDVETPTIWAEVENDGKLVLEPRRFLIVGTGHSFSEPEGCELAYIGTTQLYEGAILLHLYEVVSK